MSKRGLHLYKRLALTTLTALIGLGGVAQAQNTHVAGPAPAVTILQSGPTTTAAYGGPTPAGGTISCRVVNSGNPVTIKVEVLSAPPGGTGTPITTNPGTCTTLRANRLARTQRSLRIQL
jgi:hypothetical protein